jgi:hypothetical protein
VRGFARHLPLTRLAFARHPLPALRGEGNRGSLIASHVHSANAPPPASFGSGFAVVGKKEGSGAPRGASDNIHAWRGMARLLAKRRTPRGAPMRLAANAFAFARSPVRACVSRDEIGPSASSSHRGRSTPRAVSRSRPGAWPAKPRARAPRQQMCGLLRVSAAEAARRISSAHFGLLHLKTPHEAPLASRVIGI